MEETPIHAPCRQACPAGIDVPRYVGAVAAGRYDEALAAVLEAIPLPAVCGWVCPAPCEAKCRLAGITEAPEAIRMLKRFAAEQAAAPRPAPRRAPLTGRAAAVVGAGPAGLTAAYYLTCLGHKVTVFDALPVAGGMMQAGIPPYRLPRKVLAADIEAIVAAGVELKLGVRIEEAAALRQGYDAVFIAVGAHRSAVLGIEGEEEEGVIDALSFLRAVNLGPRPAVGERVLVIGGGNSAVDAARSALRLGAREVVIAYRRSRAEMRAYPGEVDEALREGVRLEFLAVPHRIFRDKGGLKVEFRRARPGERDAAGLPIAAAGTEFSLAAETVISAVGQLPAVPPGFGLPLAGGRIAADPETLATAREGVFAGADCVTGPASVIEAIAAGKRAAASIDLYLGGPGVLPPGEGRKGPRPAAGPRREGAGHSEFPDIYPPPTALADKPPLLAVAERLEGFPPVELPLAPAQAQKEAGRCLQCDLSLLLEPEKCRGCFICQLVCSLRLEGAFAPARAALVITEEPEGGLKITITERCDNCGLCARYCPFGAITRGCRQGLGGERREAR